MSTSKSKSMYSFSKGTRFVPVKSDSPSAYYQLHGSFGVIKGKGTTMGIGKRFDKNFFMVPGSKDMPGPFLKPLPSTLLQFGAGYLGSRKPIGQDA